MSGAGKSTLVVADMPTTRAPDLTTSCAAATMRPTLGTLHLALATGGTVEQRRHGAVYHHDQAACRHPYPGGRFSNKGGGGTPNRPEPASPYPRNSRETEKCT